MPGSFFLYIVGLILGFASGAFKRVPNQQKVKGRIESFEQQIKTPNEKLTRTAIVSYLVNRETYQVKTTYQSSFYQSDKALTVCYDANNPQNSFVRTGAVIRLLVAACFVAGTVVLFLDLRSWLS